MNKTIQIFACDHRKNVDWNLPFIRLGAKNSDAQLNIKHTEFEKYDPCASEGSQIFYIYKNLKEFGQFDYIGFSHYRTFIANVKPNFGSFPMRIVKDEIIDPILTPNQQLELIKNHDLDGILPAAFYDYSYYKNCKNVQELTHMQSVFFLKNI